MADQATLQAWLTEAETALHNLMTGRSARVFVDQNGERVEYTSARRGDLSAYIQELKRQLGQSPVSGPARTFF